MNNLVITAFEPFANYITNSSLEIIRKLAINPDKQVILPVSYLKVENELEKIIETKKPKFLLCLGQSALDTEIRVEKQAVNYMKATIADNDGIIKDGEKITDGPQTILTAINIEEIVKSLLEAKIPAYISESAGSFVCNTTYYHALKKMKGNCLFIHLPIINKDNESFILNGIQLIIDYLNKK